MKRKKIVGMSLKNYINTYDKTLNLCHSLNRLTGNETVIEQFLFPSIGTISAAKDELFLQSKIGYGSQNIAPEKSGAFTGEYSIETLIELGGNYVELGHNERINLFYETPELINKKIRLTLMEKCVPVLCIGEGNKQLSSSEFAIALRKQLLLYLKNISTEDISKIIFAYEPGWAIGKTEAAPANFVHVAHKMIRKILAELYSEEISEESRIIYGGSVSKENTKTIVSSNDVDGVFIGRFGHKPENYKAIFELVKERG